MGQRIRNISAILLKCAICNFVSAGQHMVIGAEMAMPPKLVSMLSGKPVLVATASQAAEGDMMAVQQTRNADAPTTPAASGLERKSISPLPNRKQRRRKPRMAGVPVGTQAVAQVIEEPGTQAVAQETKKTDTPAKPLATMQKAEAGDPFAPAKPQITAQKTEGAETDDPFAPTKHEVTAQKTEEVAETGDPFAPTKPQAPEKKKTGGKQYRMAPIRWRVNISEAISWQLNTSSTSGSAGSSSSTNLAHTQTADINLSSYIMRPYIANVSGGIGVASRANKGGGASTDSSRSNSLYGNGRLSLFSRSYFPFVMSFNSTTANQTRSQLPNDTQVGKSLNMYQHYHKPGTDSKYRGVYQRDNYTSGLDGPTSRATLDGSYNTKLGSANDQPFEARVLRTTHAQQGDNSLNTNLLSARHVYLPPDSLLSLTSNASLTTTSQINKAFTSTTPSNYKVQILQASTVADWQPESEDIPLIVTGGGRIFRAQTSTDGVSVPVTQSLGGSILANYIASPNLTYSADGNVARTSSGATSGMVTAQSGRVSYRSNPIKIANANYSLSSHGGIRNQTGAAPDSGAFGSAGHVLAGNYSPSLFGKKLGLRYGVNQSLGVATSRVSGQSGMLVNGGFLGWASPSNEMVTGGASVSVTDTRTFGKDSGHTLSVLLSFGGIGQKGYGYGYKASVYGIKIVADASLAASYSQQRDSMGNKSGGMQILPSANGSATYRKGNVFGVRRLVYSGALKADVRPRPPNQGAWSIVWRPVRYDLTQTLAYRIGMNEARLVGNLNEQHNGVKNASLFIQFMAWRSIGN